MVSADNLHHDVLHLIFAFLDGNDLVSVSQVSRSFLAAVIPKLYRKLYFRLGQAKKYPRTATPFATVLKHPELAVHVKACEIFALPSYKGDPHQAFISDAINALALCSNLQEFVGAHDSLPSFLVVLASKDRLKDVRVNANLTVDQTQVLIRVKGLQRLVLDRATGWVVGLLPRWVNTLKTSLSYLAITKSEALNTLVLQQTLSQLPSLLGLQILSCPKVEHDMVLKIASEYCPKLESLSFTSWEPTRTSDPAELSHLSHLTIDTRDCILPVDTAPPIWTDMLSYTQRYSIRLSSLTLKLNDKCPVADSFMEELARTYARSMKDLRLINCEISTKTLESVIAQCVKLERLTISIPIKDLSHFTAALSRSRSLTTLIDCNDAHSSHGHRSNLTKSEAVSLMTRVPTLKKLINDGRSWTGLRSSDGRVQVDLERLRPPFASSYLSMFE